MQCRSLNTVSTACGASFHSDCYLFTIDSAVITDKARSSVLPYLLTLVLRASHLHVVCSAFTGMLRCRDQSFWPQRVKPTLAASAFVAAMHTHIHTHGHRQTHIQEPHVFCSTVSKRGENLLKLDETTTMHDSKVKWIMSIHDTVSVFRSLFQCSVHMVHPQCFLPLVSSVSKAFHKFPFIISVLFMFRRAHAIIITYLLCNHICKLIIINVFWYIGQIHCLYFVWSLM